MSSLRRYTDPVDGTIPVPALLYDDEQLLASQDGVGIYDGLQKSPQHQSGTVHVTTHRLFFISLPSSSFSLSLSHVTRTEYYAGLFTSSSKATLHLAPFVSGPSVSGVDQVNGLGESAAFDSWECEVCGNRNPPGLSPAAARVCGLCGVPRESVPPPLDVKLPPATAAALSSSLPSTSALPSRLTSKLPATTPSTPPSAHHKRQPSSIACTACTFLNHPSMRECEICGSPLPQPTSSSSLAPSQTKSTPVSRPTSPDEVEWDQTREGMIRLSFRKGGDKAFYAILKRSLLGKAWENKQTIKPLQTGGSGVGATGIHGILNTVSAAESNAATSMTSALQDLEALMVQARSMAALAEDLNARLSASTQAGAEPEEATFVRSSLAQLGMHLPAAPPTASMDRDERAWADGLAVELGAVLQGSPADPRTRMPARPGLMAERGIIPLDEVWGAWNRARGVALLPPSTLLQVMPHLSAHTDPPILHRTLQGGLSVLHTPRYSRVAFAARLSSELALSGPRTTADVAREESISLGLADALVCAAEEDGDVIRDQEPGAGGMRVWWWANVFKDYVWDGQVY